MFKQAKSIILWTLLYKFRKRVTLIALLLGMILFAQWIYADIVEYLTLTNKLEYLSYLLMVKWIMIFSNLTVSIYLILTMFKPSKNKKQKIKNETKDKFSNREKELLNKKLRSKADILMDR